jgi:hypothetical protein
VAHQQTSATAQGVSDSKRHKKSFDHAKKYWWLGVIVMPLLMFMLARWWPESKQSSAPTSVVTNFGTIQNEFLTFTGQPLTDPAVKKLIEQALNSTAKGDYRGSIPLYEEALKQAPIPALYNNLGAAYMQINDSAHARDALNQAVARNKDYAPALKNLNAVDAPRPEGEEHISITKNEHEPNDDVFHANVILLNQRILGTISPNSDVDTFQFETASKSRDFIDVVLENGSNTLQPSIRVLSANKETVVGWSSAGTVGADHSLSFVASPRSKWFIQVASAYGSSGTYVLTVKPRNAFDRYEPNDTIAEATPISVGSPVEANIMDGGDLDCYTFQSQAGGPMTVVVENTSTTLAPLLRVRNADKSDITGWQTNVSAGGDLKVNFQADANKRYYIELGAYEDASAGSYRLVVR